MKASAGEVRKAVIPAAGLGTRFFPLTKAQPKEMLPVLDKPTIQYVVEEAIASGIRDILIITGKDKRPIEDHFDSNIELEMYFKEKGNGNCLKELKEIEEMAEIFYVRQKKRKGLGDAILCAEKHIGSEPFAILLGDTIIKSRFPCIQQLIKEFKKYRNSVIAVEKVEHHMTERYGIVSAKRLDEYAFIIEDLVEKPTPDKAPSNLAIIGRYILTPEIFDCIRETPVGFGDEVQLTDSLRILLRKQSIYAYIFEGKRYDIGSKMDLFKANVELLLEKENYKEEVFSFLRGLLNE
jgi:UTP--glucose-1-phosphate uridylyltransferase